MAAREPGRQPAAPARALARLSARGGGAQRPSAQYLEQRFGAAGRVVAGDIGLLGYRFHGAVWDLFGLASYDRTLRHGGELLPYLRELLAREPDAIVLCFNAQSPQGREAARAPQVSRSEPQASEDHRAGEAERTWAPRRRARAVPARRARARGAAEFRARYAPAAEFGRDDVPDAYHVVFTRKSAGEPAP